MADQMTRRALGFAGMVAFTAALGGGLLAIDRAILGPPEPAGWVETTDLSQVPGAAGLEPRYLPDELRWPPLRALYNPRERAAWVEVQYAASSTTALWIGSGPRPSELGEFTACLEQARMADESPPRPQPSCTAPWRSLMQTSSVGPIYVLTRLDEGEARRIATHLGSEVK